MALYLVTAPVAEPIDLAEAKAQARVLADDENSFLEEAIISAREFVQNYVHRALMTQTWDLTLDCLEDRICLPWPPLQSVTSISYIDTTGATQTLSTSRYTVHGGFTPSATVKANPYAMPGYITRAYASPWPVTRAIPECVTVRFVAGYGDNPEDVPSSLRSAIKIKVADLFNIERESKFVGTSMMPTNVLESILWPFKVIS